MIMSRNKLVASVQPALTSYSSGTELAGRLQRLSITHQRFYHSSNRLLGGIKLHAPPDRAEKYQSLPKPSGNSSKPQSTIRRKPEVQVRTPNTAKEDDTQVIPQRGGLASNSIFSDFIPSSKPAPRDGEAADVQHEFPRSPDTLSAVLNPKPHARAMWQRKMLIRSLRKRGRLTKEEKILQTERSSLTRSHFFKTSIKKLAPLARQIAGKTIDEAILQMRFSPKKVAQDVRQHLIHARNEAIAARGMGLGSGTSDNAEVVTGDTSIVPLSPIHNPTLSLRKGLVADPTQIYIAQAWVNRGPYGRELEPRAMGRANILRPPHTGISVLLKEERTRTREKLEKEIKERNQRLGSSHWRQLPDRKIYHQRPFYSW